jgi:1-deoxy-D-xylulose-5-phosphate reductoisomerase
MVYTPSQVKQQPVKVPHTAKPDPPRRRLVILGSTGSIGVNTLKVVEHLNATAPARHTATSIQIDNQPGNSAVTQTSHRGVDVVGLAAGRDAASLIDQARRYHAPAVAIADASQEPVLRQELPGVEVYAGPDASLRLIENADATDVSAAIVGSAGLPATLAAIRKGLTIGLANKETLVAAGPLVSPMVRRHSAKLIPVDSEHSAVYQCMRGQDGAGSSRDDPSNRNNQQAREVKRIVLTASGGPFRTVDKQAMDNATVEQALRHPTWNMGPKITIDSATMMNKALEIIEAHWLFGLPADKIDVVIHPQSIVHSFVEFADNSILAQMGPPDMKTPIQYALAYPQRPPGCSEALDWTTLSRLDFEQPDHDKFRSLKLAYDVIRAGGTAGAIFNGANEAAVAAFLDRRIRFGRIVELVDQALDRIDTQEADSLETILAADQQARDFVNLQIDG